MRSSALLAITLSVVGCSASLSNVDGYYGCADSHCPSGLLCHSDQRCYHSPEDAATLPDDGGADAYPPPIDMGSMGTCTGTMTGPCTPPQQCVPGQWTPPPNMPTNGCARPMDIANTAHGTACTPGPSSGCITPDVCIMNAGGTPHCMRPCPPGSTCGFGEDCVALGGGGVCLPTCNSVGPPCPMFGLSCSASAQNHCAPPGW